MKKYLKAGERLVNVEEEQESSTFKIKQQS